MLSLFKKRTKLDIATNEELAKLVNDVYASLECNQSRYAYDFKYIIGGCHGYPYTDWYEEIYIVFNKLLKDNAIGDRDLNVKAKQIVLHFKKWFH